LSDMVSTELGRPAAVDCVADGYEGLQLAERAVYDVIFVSSRLPLMRGENVSEVLRIMGVPSPIVLVVSQGDTIQGDKICPGLPTFEERHEEHFTRLLRAKHRTERRRRRRLTEQTTGAVQLNPGVSVAGAATIRVSRPKHKAPSKPKQLPDAITAVLEKPFTGAQFCCVMQQMLDVLEVALAEDLAANAIDLPEGCCPCTFAPANFQAPDHERGGRVSGVTQLLWPSGAHEGVGGNQDYQADFRATDVERPDRAASRGEKGTGVGIQAFDGPDARPRTSTSQQGQPRKGDENQSPMHTCAYTRATSPPRKRHRGDVSRQRRQKQLGDCLLSPDRLNSPLLESGEMGLIGADGELRALSILTPRTLRVAMDSIVSESSKPPGHGGAPFDMDQPTELGGGLGALLEDCIGVVEV